MSWKNRFLQLRFEELEARRLLAADVFRAIDGSFNNLQNPEWGKANTQLVRTTSIEYADGISEPAGGSDGSGRPNPREISNRVVAQTGEILNDRQLTNFLFQWGQFVDHDLDLTGEAHPLESFGIPVPKKDPYMLPTTEVPLFRSHFDPSTGTSLDNPRQQINQITAFLDASNVYGSDPQRGAALRTMSGGRMQTSAGDLLPYNVAGLGNAAPPPLAASDYFLAGDVRANEQPGLTSLHTLFVREHNRLADQIAERDFADQDLDAREIDETIYQRARQIVGGLVQSITYNEFLPALLGPNGLSSYVGYDASVNPGIANIFSAALYRVGHTMLPNELLQLDDAGGQVGTGSVGLAASFFQPSLVEELGIEPFLKGLSVQQSQEIDVQIVDGVRNMLFDPPAQFDLAAINIQRGRDHGLPDYNQARVDLGLERIDSFRQITADRATRQNLQRAYQNDIDNIDVWLGAIAEDHLPGSSVGELVHTVLVDQFQRTRDGDRFFYEQWLDSSTIKEINETRLADIIRRNTSIQNIQDEVFRSESVLVFRAASDHASDIQLQLANRHIQIVDGVSGQIVKSAPRDDVSSIVLFGSSAADSVLLHPSVQRLGIPVEIHGGGGEDRLHVLGSQSGDSIVIEEHQLRFNETSVFFGNFELLVVEGQGGDDYVNGALASVPLILSGGGGHDILIGGRYDDVLDGGSGHDWLFGMAGNDMLVGGAGRDVVSGGSGNDLLIGGRGRDFLWGDPGVDRIVRGSVASAGELADSLWADLAIRWEEFFR